MAVDNPCPCPAPLVLADLSAQRAWDNSVHDQCRMLHEWNADTVRAMHAETARLRQRNEQLEAELEKTFTYVNSLLAQKGGAA